MYAFPIKLNLWKDVGNTIFPHDFINFPMFWKYDVSFTFQSLETARFQYLSNLEMNGNALLEIYTKLWKAIETGIDFSCTFSKMTIISTKRYKITPDC